MKAIKRLVAVALIPMGIAALAGCGGDGSSYPDVSHDYVLEELTTDTAPDIPIDTTPDTGFDTGFDTTPDTHVDTTPDPTYDDVGPVTGGVGSTCTTAAQCTGVPAAGDICLQDFMSYLSFPGGYCSAVCTSAADCGAGAACVDLFGFDQYCLKTCTSPSQCRTAEGYSCTTLSGVTGGPYCLPPATSPETAVDY